MKTCGIKLDLCVRACSVWYLFFFLFWFFMQVNVKMTIEKSCVCSAV